MDKKIYVFGHQNPDTDSICSSIAYANLKRLLGYCNTQEVRLGETSKETRYVLDYFQIDTPPLLNNVRPQISDLSIYHPFPLSKDAPIKSIWERLQLQSSNIIPVVNEVERLDGIITMGDLTSVFMDSHNNFSFDDYIIKYYNLLDVLEGILLSGQYKYENICGEIYFDSTFDKTTRFNDKDIIVTARITTLEYYANYTDVGCILITDGIEVDLSDIDNLNCAIISVPFTYYQTINLLKHCISLDTLMRTNDIECFSYDDYLDDITDIMKESVHRNFPVLNTDGKFCGILSRRHLLNYERKKVILIDHNERSQSVEGVEHATILEIIDHHRVADIQTIAPLFIRSEPVGCTATIVYKLYLENKIQPDKTIAGLLLAAILSDTLMLRSPTCTDEDKKIAEKLADISGLTISEFGFQMLKAGTSLQGYTPIEILKIDRKEFNFDKLKVCISQVNTMDLVGISEEKGAFLDAMNEMVVNKGYDLFIFMITDVYNAGSLFLVSGKAKDVFVHAFSVEKFDGTVYLAGILSRKKQVVPKLLSVLQY